MPHKFDTNNVQVRRWRKSDLPAILQCQNAAYPRIARESLVDERKLLMQMKAFPEGQYLAEIDGRVVGYCTSLIVQIDDDSPWYSYDEITGIGTFSTHNPSGDTLYGSDIAVHPDFRGREIASKLYAKRKALLKKYNLRRMVAGGRIPGYAKHASKMSAEQYIEKVKQGKLKDMALSAHLKAGYEVPSVHYAYLNDRESMNYATFLTMDNPEFNSDKHQIAAAPLRRTVRKVRVCAAQYQMRHISEWSELEQQVRFFVETADEYHCHFLLMPELFTAQLFSFLPAELDSKQAVRELASYHRKYVDMFTQFATEYGLYIVGGSHPVLRKGLLYNTGHLFTPSGQCHTQDKFHISDSERHYYGMRAGDKLNVFDTPLGRIGMLLGYDIEFPELVRLVALRGVEILFLPYATDERNSYMRVRYCAQSRAVENVMYVVMTGCIGNLPRVRNFLVNYSQAAVCTPCDIAFPSDGTMGEADAASETVTIAELDLNDLAQARDIGSVKPLRDRRLDFYSIKPRNRIEIINVN